MRVSARGVTLVKQFEGFRPNAYRDAVGVLTQGYGDTANLTPGKPWSESYASQRLERRLNRDYGAAVERLVDVPLSQAQFDALVSFAYNVGIGALGGSTLLRYLNARNYRRAADEFLKWDKAGGRSLLGLTRRRKAERALFLSGERAGAAFRDELRHRRAQLKVAVAHGTRAFLIRRITSLKAAIRRSK